MRRLMISLRKSHACGACAFSPRFTSKKTASSRARLIYPPNHSLPNEFTCLAWRLNRVKFVISGSISERRAASTFRCRRESHDNESNKRSLPGDPAICPSQWNSVGRHPAALLSTWDRQLDSLHLTPGPFRLFRWPSWIPTWYPPLTVTVPRCWWARAGEGTREDCRLHISGTAMRLGVTPKDQRWGQEIEPGPSVPKPPHFILSNR